MPADQDTVPAPATEPQNGEPLHVLFFCDTYRPYVSGVVTSMDIYAAELRGLGHRVTIVAPEYPGEPDEPDLIRLPSLAVPGYARLRQIAPVNKAAKTRLADLRPDIVHTHSPLSVGQLGVTIARAAGCPVVFTCHSFYEEYARYAGPLSYPLKPAIRRYLVGYCGDCDLVIAPSRHMRDFLAVIGVECPVAVLPTGVRPAESADLIDDTKRTLARAAAQRGSVFVLAMLGRLAKEKTPELALQTMFELAQRDARARDRWRLLVIGDGPEGERLRAMPMDLGIKSLVEFTGEVPRREVFNYLGMVDAMIFTSQVETQGLAMLEGMAMGLPVVAVESPAARELVRDGLEGFVRPADPVAMAEAVRELAGQPELARRMGEAALERSRAFHPTLLARRLEAIYRGLRRGGQPPARRSFPWSMSWAGPDRRPGKDK